MNRGQHRIIDKKKGAKNPIKTLRKLLGYIFKDYKWSLLLVCVLIIIVAATTTINALFLEVLVDDYIRPLIGTVEPVYTGLITVILIMMSIYIGGIISTYIFNIIMVKVSQGTLKKLRDEMFVKMQSLPINYFDTTSHGDIMSRYTNDTETLRQMISQSLPQIFRFSITLLMVFVSMLVNNLLLTLIVVLFVIFMICASKFIAKKSGKYFVNQQRALGKLNGYIEEMIHGQKVIKVFNHEETAKNEFEILSENLRENAANANKHANTMMPVMHNIGLLQFSAIAIIGAILALTFKDNAEHLLYMSVGKLVSFLQLSRSFTNPISQMAQQLNSIVMALAGAERIFELLDQAEEIDDGFVTLVNANVDSNGIISEADHITDIWAWKYSSENGDVEYRLLKGDIRFYDVDFAYPTSEMILHDVSIYAEPGQKLAFVGATGAGKTTITNLINRFYDIADGKISYDGININTIKKSSLRSSLGIVLQDTSLFTGTVMENIRYGKLDATDEDVYKAARLANADEFIRRLPEGYNTVLTGDGGNLSQGQRQLLSIARAAVSNAPVMILDEATSSIDTRTEKLVQKGTDELMKGRTVFVIAHRLSTIMNSDVIMVLDQGRIVERGSHDKLIEKQGIYYQLYTGAFELE
ncbi:MAG: ABC transporter ATP-binding protein [Bacilli bacterium]|nr:ABC transporter ATP-binding protein [Bacilli bacterium]